MKVFTEKLQNDSILLVEIIDAFKNTSSHKQRIFKTHFESELIEREMRERRRDGQLISKVHVHKYICAEMCSIHQEKFLLFYDM